MSKSKICKSCESKMSGNFYEITTAYHSGRISNVLDREVYCEECWQGGHL